MKSLKGSKTAENLLKSFAGESQARMRYTYYSSVAKKEGYVCLLYTSLTYYIWYIDYNNCFKEFNSKK